MFESEAQGKKLKLKMPDWEALLAPAANAIEKPAVCVDLVPPWLAPAVALVVTVPVAVDPALAPVTPS